MGLFDKFKKGLEKTREFFTGSITKIAASLGKFDEEQLDELEMILISADCGMEVTELLMEEVKNQIKATGDNSVEAVLGTLKRESLRILRMNETKDGAHERGGEIEDPEAVEDVHLTLQPGLNILVLQGVNGTGKTTSAGKIAAQFAGQGKKVLLCAADTFRAAAIEQLEVWSQRAGVPLIKTRQGADPAAVVFDAIQSAKAGSYDLLVIDTAGRLHTKKNLMAELGKIDKVIRREGAGAQIVNLLVLDATTGQNAVTQANAFGELGILDGLIVTKLDGNAKGGIILSVCYNTHLKIYMVGLGEGIEDLDDFKADLFVDSLLPDPSLLLSHKKADKGEEESTEEGSEAEGEEEDQ